MQSHPSFSQFSNDEAVWGILGGLEEIAKEIGSTIPAVALRWLLQKPTVPSLVIGCRTLEQLNSNLQAASIALTPAHMTKLDALSAVAPPYREFFCVCLFGGVYCRHFATSISHTRLSILITTPSSLSSQLTKW